MMICENRPRIDAVRIRGAGGNVIRLVDNVGTMGDLAVAHSFGGDKTTTVQNMSE